MSNKVLYLLYTSMMFCYLVDHIDQGIISAAAEQIRSDLNLSESQLGLMESFNYMGNIAGTFLFPFLMRKIHPKVILISAALFDAGFAAIIPFSTEFWHIAVSRIGFGFFQVSFMIYFPVWIDEKGPAHLKTMWMSCIVIAVGLGVVVGYGITAVVINFASWKYCFFAQSILLIVPVSIFFLLIPKSYFETGKNTNEETSKLIDQSSQTLDKSIGQKRIEVSMSQSRLVTTFMQENKGGVLPVSTIIFNLFKNPTYILTVLAMTSLMFVITALQYWITYYCTNALGADPNTVYIIYATALISAPVIGSIVGGVVTGVCIGGYTNRRALILSFFLFCCICATLITISLTDNFVVFASGLYFFLFLQGFIQPGLTGMMISSCNVISRPTASSLSILIYNIIGYLPSPYIYGAVSEATTKLDSEGNNITKVGMQVICFSSIVGVFCLGLAIILRNRSVMKDLQLLKTSLIQSKELTDQEIEQVIAAEGQDLKDDFVYRMSEDQPAYTDEQDPNRITDISLILMKRDKNFDSKVRQSDAIKRSEAAASGMGSGNIIPFV